MVMMMIVMVMMDPSWQLPYDKKKFLTEDDNLPSDDEFEGDTPDCEKKVLFLIRVFLNC